MVIKKILFGVDRLITEKIPSIIEKIRFGTSVDFSLGGLGVGAGYMPSFTMGMKQFIRLTKTVDNSSNVLEIGCGKGKMLYLFIHWFAPNRVDGIEYDSRLVEIAQNNMRILDLDTTIYEADAADFDKYDIYNVFYLYNPFNDEVFSRVLERITESLKYNPRKIHVIYYNPVYDDVIQRMNYKLKYSKTNFFRKITGRAIYIYEKTA